MEELRNFRKINHLTQGQLGDYLGIKKSFISRVENGQVALPLDKFKKLMENTMGWDTSVLKRFYETYDPKSPRPIHVIDLFSGPKKNVAEQNTNVTEYIAMLKKRIDDLEKQNTEYWDMIKKLTDK